MVFLLIFVQIVTFIVLALIMRTFLISSSYKETLRLQQLNEDSVQKSQELAGKIADVEVEYKERMARADEEIRELKASARKEMEQIKEALVAAGKAEGARIVAQALNTKEEIRAEIEEQMKDKSVALSCKIFQKVLSSDEQKFVYEGLLESVFRELDNIDGRRLKEFGFDMLADGAVEVKTSHAMSQMQKEKLETILCAKLGHKVNVREMIEREVICGIIIAIGSFVIDGSLLERFKKAAQAVE